LIRFTTNHQLKQRASFSSLMARLDAYDENHTYCVNAIERNLKEQVHGNRTAYQNMGSGFLVGSTKVAANTLITVAGAKYARNAPRTNALLFTASVEYLPGGAWGLIDNIRIQTTSEINRRRARKNHQQSGQILITRLKQLDQIKEKI